MPESARHRWEAERTANGPLVTLTLTTRVPSKWVAVDRETGHCWEWRDGKWVLDPPAQRRLRGAVRGLLG